MNEIYAELLSIFIVITVGLLVHTLTLRWEYNSLKRKLEFVQDLKRDSNERYFNELKKCNDLEAKYETLLHNFQGYVEKYKLKESKPDSYLGYIADTGELVKYTIVSNDENVNKIINGDENEYNDKH